MCMHSNKPAGRLTQVYPQSLVHHLAIGGPFSLTKWPATTCTEAMKRAPPKEVSFRRLRGGPLLGLPGGGPEEGGGAGGGGGGAAFGAWGLLV